MKLLAVTAMLAAALPAQEIPKGTHVLLNMSNTVNTRTAREGDMVYLTTASPIAAGGQIIVPVGSHVTGVVVQADRGGRVHGRAQVAIRLERLIFSSGREAKFTPKVSSVDSEESGQRVMGEEGRIQQGSSAGKKTAQIAIFAGSGAALGSMIGSRAGGSAVKGLGIGAGSGAAVGLATALLTRGKDLELRRGSSIDVVFDRALTLE